MEFPVRLDIYAVLLFMGIGQMLANVLFLSLRKRIKKDKSTWFLAFILIVLTFNILEPVLIRTRFLFAVPHLLYIGPSFLLLLGPLVYLHILALNSPKFKWKPIYFLHAVPFLLMKVKTFPMYFQSVDQKKEILRQFYLSEPSADYLLASGDVQAWAIQLHPIIYMLIGAFVMHRAMKEGRTRFNSFHKLYLISLFIAVLFYLFGGVILSLLGVYSLDLYWAITTLLIYGFVCIVSFLILTSRLTPVVVKKELLKDSKAEEMYSILMAYMRDHRPYRSSDISLNSLALMIGITPHYLSRMIKEFENKTFLEFINYHRVEDVKNLVTDPSMKHFTLEAIGQEAGFANKMSLSRAFKKYCGTTPSAYRSKKLLEENK